MAGPWRVGRPMQMTTQRRTSIERPTAASSERCFLARSTLLEALVAASYVEYGS